MMFSCIVEAWRGGAGRKRKGREGSQSRCWYMAIKSKNNNTSNYTAMSLKYHDVTRKKTRIRRALSCMGITR